LLQLVERRLYQKICQLLSQMGAVEDLYILILVMENTVIKMLWVDGYYLPSSLICYKRLFIQASGSWNNRRKYTYDVD
jgi:hypothetical protein